MNHNQDEIQEEDTPERKSKTIALRPITIILFLVVNLIVMVVLGWPYLQARYHLPFDLPVAFPTMGGSVDTTPAGNNAELEASPGDLESTPGVALPPPATPLETLPFEHIDSDYTGDGLILLSMQAGLDSHLFVYQPPFGGDDTMLPFTRLTAGSWEDITPTNGPKSNLAFASNREGYWDIYMMDLASGEIRALTDTPEYDASPSFSPDGLWMAYESYVEDNLEILIQLIDDTQQPIRLTTHQAADHSPAWSPLGRQIAFVSTRGGSSQIWLANLDESGSDRFVTLSQPGEASATHPAWSPDGRYLAWSAVTTGGLHQIYVWDSSKPESPPRESGSGDWAVWSPDGQALLTVVKTPYQSYLTAYRMDQAQTVILPPAKLSGPVSGLVWSQVILDGSVLVKDWPKPTPLWQAAIQTRSQETNGRWDLMPLEDVEAPYARLHDLVDESFVALRQELASQVGWDALASLENAYLPLSSALSPGLAQDWLYTGRAFAINTLPINAGWMVVVREDFGLQTFWRVYLRARFQDGSQGRPLQGNPWDFNARYSGKPAAYDQGGEYSPAVPTGYWVELTNLASLYGWERLPALANWRAAYPATRFNEFVNNNGLDWESAILEIYPDEVLLTLTPAPTATPSPTPAPLWFRSPTPTPTLRLTATPSPTTSPTSLPSATAPPPTLTATSTLTP